MKKLISFLTLLATVLTLALPAAAFSDIHDPETSKAVAVLQMMGVIDGVDEKRFVPDGTLTRAQFCKMAVLLKGDGDQEPLYRNRTIFPDVRSTHWARGYINLAVSTTIGADADGKGGVRLIRGTGDGKFQPDRPITYAEATAILLRLLGWSDADAGMNWPQGYLSLASKVGLGQGLSLTAGQNLTRGQAARLFYSALGAQQKDGTAYYNTLGTVTTGVVVFDVNAETASGAEGALRTSAGTYEPSIRPAAAELTGSRGVLITDENDKVLTLYPEGRQETVVIRSAKNGAESVDPGSITGEDGKKYEIESSAKVYTATGSSTYQDAWTNLRPGTPVTLYYTDGGKVDALYAGSSPKDLVAVAYRGVSDVRSLVEGIDGYGVYRDGVSSGLGSVCKYDVAVYDPALRALLVSSAKVSGKYEKASPNPQHPSKITILGTELEVLDQAVDDLAAFKPGDSITVLLTPDSKVAGVVSGSELREINVGILEASGKIRLLNGLVLDGAIAESAAYAGELVSVNSGADGTLGVGRMTQTSAMGSLDLEARTLGKDKLSPGCRFFDSAGSGIAVEVTEDAVRACGADNARVAYVHRTTGGTVDVLVFDNVTGDAFVYGRLKVKEIEVMKQIEDEKTGELVSIQIGSKWRYGVINADHPTGSGEAQYIIKPTIDERGYIGLLVSSDGKYVTDIATLTERKGVSRNDFYSRGDAVYLNIGSHAVRVSDRVQCYNEATGVWFDSLDEARAYSDNLTVYYDKSPEKGGQIRIVVAE